MGEANRGEPQLIGQADARAMKPREQKQGKEGNMSPEQQQFFNRYQAELARAQNAEKAANQHARDKMKGLTAPELRKIGAKQFLWGWGLSIFNGIGIGVGWLGGVGVVAGMGALTQAAAGTAIASALGIATVASIAAIPIGVVGGAIAGAELARFVYNKFARNHDASLPKLDKTDRILGDVFAVSGWTPPMVAGVRNIFEGYNNMKSIQ